ncbi:hypothetical protein [Sagittula stellata]|uniref:Uncharacterized protein n=1 Tax=Sagittula stellata (strain ATCC 700073 / DSM 11524 / E-37) TaxID=388399 RepID=A3K4W7_SAGS3|nr:hypothetical protein [Sagittula stellata]EBA08016.1 hypothetical protein SSE37_02145 [Sagittula stellata E-37]
MSERDQNRIEILSLVVQGRMAAGNAANLLALSRRQVSAPRERGRAAITFFAQQSVGRLLRLHCKKMETVSRPE